MTYLNGLNHTKLSFANLDNTNSANQQLINQFNDTEIKDTYTPSNNTAKKSDDKKKKTAIIASIVAVIVVLGGIIWAARHGKKPKAKDVEKAAKDIIPKPEVPKVSDNNSPVSPPVPEVPSTNPENIPVSETGKSKSTGTTDKPSPSETKSTSTHTTQSEVAQENLDRTNARIRQVQTEIAQQEAKDEAKIKQQGREIEEFNRSAELERQAIVDEVKLKAEQDQEDLLTKTASQNPILNKCNDENLVREVIRYVKKKESNIIDFNILKAITPKNKDVYKEVLDYLAANAAKLKIDNPNVTISFLEAITQKNKGIYKEVLDHLAVNANKFKIQNSNDFIIFLEAITPENKDNYKEILEHLVTNADKFKITHGYELANVLKAITSGNKDIYKEVLEHLAVNTDKFKIECASDTAKLLEAITPKNKSIYKEILKDISDSAKKLKIRNGSDMGEILSIISPENKECIKLIANNAEKLKLKDINEVIAYIQGGMQDLLKKL